MCAGFASLCFLGWLGWVVSWCWLLGGVKVGIVLGGVVVCGFVACRFAGLGALIVRLSLVSFVACFRIIIVVVARF